ncbi:hypothetical protein [Streptomyces sp. A1136]|uniref:hypothetical protein n=1 Tax=Streptomyces sp. A1136 TaxID=2563102 RepID=UPI00109E6A5D|nr:hypothetical protein [Streptomyces sp. A1136]THA56142.1 hypothetical protein E6R62_12420 [Streptomyces sp. A1136]
MTHSPTPTELLALRTANAALMSPDSCYDFASTIVFALGSAQLLQSPETAAELARLRARVAELEAERHETNEVLSDAAEQLRADRDRIAGLEAERRTIAAARDAQIIAWLGKKSREYGTSNRENRAKAEAVARMADKLSRGAVRRPLEDPHDSPLHHTYRTGHDLPHCECPPSAGRHTSACPLRFTSEVPRG